MIVLIHRTSSEEINMKPGGGNLNSGCVLFAVGSCYEDLSEIDEGEFEYIEGYRPGQEDDDYIFGIQINSWISVSALTLDEKARADIFDMFNRKIASEARREGFVIKSDSDIEDLLDGSREDIIQLDGDFSWEMQRMRAERAARMGYQAVVDRDENGEVYVVDFSNSNSPPKIERLFRISDLEEMD